MRALIQTGFLCLLLLGPLVGSSNSCTDFCFDTPGGPIFGCNLDLFIPGDGLVFINPRGIAKEGFQESTTGETAKWVSKYGSVTFRGWARVRLRRYERGRLGRGLHGAPRLGIPEAR